MTDFPEDYTGPRTEADWAEGNMTALWKDSKEDTDVEDPQEG